MFATIVIPIHNEQDSLSTLLNALHKSLKTIKEKIEVILVDDASRDNSAQIIKKFIKNKPAFKLIQRTSQGGQTGSYRVAFKEAQGKFLIRMDGDMQDNPSQLPLFIEKFKQGNEIVVGLRSRQSHHAINIFASRLFDLLALLVFKSPFFSNTASFVGFKTSLVQDVPLKRTWYFKNEHRYLVLIALSKKPKKYTEMVVEHNPRMGGKSKYKKYKKYFTAAIEFAVIYFRLKRNYYSRRRRLR